MFYVIDSQRIAVGDVLRSVLISAPGAHARQASAKKHPMRYNGSGSDGMTDTSLVRA